MLAAALLASVSRAQIPASALGDSAAVAGLVRDHPVEAQALLRRFIEQAGRSPSRADSLLREARRVAMSFAEMWNDSSPLSAVRRFERLTPDQRSRKVSADSVRAAGNAALDRRGVPAAMSLWRRAAGRSFAVPDTAGAAAALGNVGAGFYRLSELDSAELYLTKARALAEAVGDVRTTLNALGILGSVAKDRGDLPRALELYTRGLTLRTAIGDARGAAGDHNNLGLIAFDLDDLAGARGHYDKALELARQHKLNDIAGTASLNLANAASVDGRYSEAFARYREALSLFRAEANDAGGALALHNLGLLALRRGEYAEARSRLGEALVVFARAGTVEDLVQVRRALASVDAAIGNFKSALDQLRSAESLLATAPQQYDLAAGVALARADLAAQMNTFTEADRQFARAQSLYRRAMNPAGEAEARQGQAMLLIERKLYAQALQQLEVIVRIQVAAGDERPAALTRLLIGQALRQQGDTARARKTFQQALSSLHSLGDAVAEATALGALADLDLEAGTPLAAEDRFRRSLAVVQGRDVPTLSWQLHAGLAASLRSRGATLEALTELRAAIADVERVASTVPLADRRAAFLGDKWQPYGDVALLEASRGNAGAALDASERMRARQMLDVLSRGRVSRTATVDNALATREQDLRLRISELTQRLENEEGGPSTLRGPDLSRRSSGVTREALARAQADYTQLLLDLGDEAVGLGALSRASTTPWRVVAAQLSPTQALVEYLMTDSTTLAFILTRDTVRVLDLGVGRSTIASLVDFARNTLARPAQHGQVPPWRAPLRRLYQLLIAPLEDAGHLASARQLVIVPNGELHYLPFAALLRTRARDEFLIERYDIGYAPSASVWAQLGDRGPQSRTDEGDRVLALAPRSAALPGSLEEVEAIRRLYGSRATVLTDGKASERTLGETANRYDILHLATFGVLNQHNPLFSFIDLSRGGGDDGRLEVHEVFALSLRARLVVLSACQTALASGATADVPPGDDWVGLVRAFLGAGARNVIATLWAVEDQSTARVMERLHQKLRAGESEVTALSAAQRESLRNPGTAGPFHWAGFVLVGGR